MSTPEPDVRTPLRVLIVEHDAADVELNVDALQRGGFDVVHDVAATPGEFARLLAIQEYDVVVADYRLPHWTGMDAFRALRIAGFHTPLILVTGTLGDERAVECVKLGVADYILKQNLARLPVAVHRALEESRAHADLVQAELNRREAEQRLRERDERFEQLAATISEVFFLIDAQSLDVLYINQAWEAMWGRPRAELYANPRAFLESVFAEDLGRVTENIAMVQAGNDAGEIEFRILKPDGSHRWVRSHAVPIRDARGAVYRIAGVILDISERRQAQIALQESEELFRKITEATFDAIVVSQEGIIREANHGFIEMFGFSNAAEVIGRPSTDFAAPESRALVASQVQNQVETTYQFVGLRKDGRKTLIEATARSHVVHGRPGRVTALRDISEQRLLEDQFRQAQKMEAMGRLAGGVAHDFNNLLTVISSYTDFVYEEMTTGDPRRNDLEQIRAAATAASTLTRQLLAFSRQQVIQPRMIVLEEVVHTTEKMLRRVIGEDITVGTVLSETPLHVNIDAGQLEQVIMNLAVNARDAMPTGGKLTIETAAVDLDANYAEAHWPAVAGRFAMLALSDTGIGMDAATRSRIFEPFFTTKEVGKGTGLGLASVYGIVKQNGGFIWVYSEPGEGATFKVYLPLLEEGSAEQLDIDALGDSPRGTETILLVEDAISLRAAVRKTLSRLGYVVLEAANGRAALSVAAQNRGSIALLLTDVVMPEMGGSQLAAQLAALGSSIKVLYMSGYTDDSAVRHGVLTASVEYIQKPFTPDGLARKVRAVLDAKAASG